jgi:hypothetical protein
MSDKGLVKPIDINQAIAVKAEVKFEGLDVEICRCY